MSGGNNNATVSFPGPGWAMLWPDQFDNFQLDIVGFLAILGEASILANAQVSALSRLFYLPRLLPAPQALLRVSRPVSLPPISAHVNAVHTGNKKHHVHHVASVLLGTSAEELPKFAVRCVRVEKKKQESKDARPQTLVDRFFRGQPKRSFTDEKDDKPAPVLATVKAKAAGPLTWVTLLGFSLALAIAIVSIVYGDGMSLMAAIALSLLSSIVGICNKWNLKLPDRPKNAVEVIPDGTTVIRYPQGSFLVVICNDVVARELFFAPEEIDYTIKNQTVYRLLALVGSIMLMLGVILLANARLELQIAWAAAYLILNAAHWIAAALPAKMHWDLSCYEVREEGIEGGPTNTGFTEALWKAILVTRSTEWVYHGEAAPRTPVWDTWLQAALEAAGGARCVKKGKLISPVPDWSRHGCTGVVHELPRDGFDPKTVYNDLERREVDRAQRKAEEGRSCGQGLHARAGAPEPPANVHV